MDITFILYALITLAVLALTIYIIPLIRKKYGQGAIDESMSKLAEAIKWIDIFVEAAEEIYPDDVPEGKKLYVTELVRKKLNERGITYDEEVISALIESSVLKLHNSLYGKNRWYINDEVFEEGVGEMVNDYEDAANDENDEVNYESNENLDDIACDKVDYSNTENLEYIEFSCDHCNKRNECQEEV